MQVLFCTIQMDTKSDFYFIFLYLNSGHVAVHVEA